MEKLKKITLNDVPGGYAMCSRGDCAARNHCLRHIAFREVGKDLKMLYQVNPLRVVPSDKCEISELTSLPLMLEALRTCSSR